jgi:hypothetical protein
MSDYIFVKKKIIKNNTFTQLIFINNIIIICNHQLPK